MNAPLTIAARMIVLALLLGISASVLAEPAPRPEEELWNGSDLIVEGRVLSIQNTSGAYFVARVQVEKTLKGKLPGNPMNYYWSPPEPDVIGSVNHNVFAGQRVRLYLIFEHGRYVPWASNSVDWIENFPENRRVLPQRMHEIIYADGEPPVAAPQAASYCPCSCRRRWRRR